MIEPPKVFVTGVTGYVGGDALFVIMAAHPTWRYTFLVRDRRRVAEDATMSRYPNVRLVVGGLEQTDLIKREAAAADIILTFASSDDVASAEAVREAVTSDTRTRFWIHTSGAANLMFDDKDRGVPLGGVSPKVWDDVGDIDNINAWPTTVFHRPVEKVVLESADGHPNVKPAVVVPPAILGVGRGPGNRRTIQVPILIELIRRRGRAFQVGQGAARWSFVHIHDLSDVYLRLVDAAAAADDGGAGADWGRDGYYFAESGELAWGDIGRRVGRRLHEAGVLSTDDLDSLGPAEATKLFGRIGPESVGANSRSRATRARTRLGWRPRISDFDAGIDEQVAVELATDQSRLDDFRKGHMPKAPPPRPKSNL